MSAVDGEDAAVDEAAGRSGQQQQGAIEFAGLAEAARGHAREQALAGLAGEEVPVEIGLDVARR